MYVPVYLLVFSYQDLCLLRKCELRNMNLFPFKSVENAFHNTQIKVILKAFKNSCN